MEIELSDIGTSIKKLRLKNKLTQAELGAKIGVQKAEICKLEKSARNFRIETIIKLFSSFGIIVKLKIN